MEPKDLLGPIATLFAVLFAIASFLFVRALELYRERQRALSEIDVPDSIRKSKAFKISVLGDFMFLFMTGVLLFSIAVIYCPRLLYRIANFYLGSPQFSSIDIVADFREMSQVILIGSSFLLSVPFVLIASDMLVGKRLPVIVRFFAGNVLGQRLVKKAEAENLLPEAQRLHKKGAFGEAVLYSVASLEVALRDKLSIPEGVGFGRLLGSVREKLGEEIPFEELLTIRKVRNIAAHPSTERQVTKEEAKEVINRVENILNRLGGSYNIIIQPEAQEELEKVTEQGRRMVVKAISRLEQEPRSQEAKKIIKEDTWVIKVGQYRVVYKIDEVGRQIIIIRVAMRTTKDIYKNL